MDAWDAGVTDETWVCAAGLGNEIVGYSENLAYRDELLEMARICRHVPLNAARSFHEAVQAIYMILLAVHLESLLLMKLLGLLNVY